MAKTIKVQNTTYDVVADVVIKDNVTSEISVTEWSGEGAGSRNVRYIKQCITDSYRSDDNIYTVIAIDNIRTYKRVSVKTYKINASALDIVNACVDAGLSVVDVDMVDAIANDNEETTIAE